MRGPVKGRLQRPALTAGLCCTQGVGLQNVVIFVDAGYLFRAGADAVAHRNVARRDVQLEDVSGLIQTILERVSSQWDGDAPRLLRAYWYDGARDGVPSPSQIAIGELPRVKLRLGRVSSGGQKGVDGLIILDLITLARNRAADIAIIVSGDEDLRETVAHVQNFGVTVAVVGFARSPRQAQSILLLREADHVVALTADDVRPHFQIQEGAGLDTSPNSRALPGASPGEVPLEAASTENAQGEQEDCTDDAASDASAPPPEAAEESLRALCEGVLDDPRFAHRGVVDQRTEGRLLRHADQVLVARLAELTGVFPVPADVLNRARTLCVQLNRDRQRPDLS